MCHLLGLVCPPRCGIKCWVEIKIIIKFYQMTEKQENLKETAKEEQELQASSEGDIETEFDDYQIEDNYQDNDLDLAEDYLNKLKIQRKRIEELSLLHLANEERLQREIERNKSLREEIQKLSSMKDYQSRYSDLAGNIQILTSQNKTLKDQIEDLKTELFTSTNERTQIIQRLRAELNLQRDKEANKIENLEEALTTKEEEVQKIERNAKLRERELMDTINSLKSTMTRLQDEHDVAIKTQQRKSDKLQRELQTRTIGINETHSNIDSLLKENSQMKEEIFRLSSMLSNRELELKNQAEKFRLKVASMKKQAKNREKECAEYRQSARKAEKDKKESSDELEDLRSQIKKIRESTEIITRRMETDFSIERQNMQAAANQHLQTIEDLVNMKNELIAENKRLQAILRKKEAVQKQRRALLRTELKEIDKLEKVIDRIEG